MKLNFKAAGFIFIILFFWHILSSSGIFNQTLFPGPIVVLYALINLTQSGELLSNVTASAGRLFFGLLTGSIFGVIFGLLMGRIGFLDEAFAPLLNILRSIPPVAIIPLMIVWFGIGDVAKVNSIAFAVFFPVWLSTLHGAKNISSNHIKTAKIFSKSVIQTFIRVIFPATIPNIISGVRLGIGTAFIMVFVSELAGASVGLGYLIAYAQITYRIDIMLAGLIVLGLLAYAVDYLFVKFSEKTFKWVNSHDQ